jgi:hypothetical protein
MRTDSRPSGLHRQNRGRAWPIDGEHVDLQYFYDTGGKVSSMTCSMGMIFAIQERKEMKPGVIKSQWMN